MIGNMSQMRLRALIRESLDLIWIGPLCLHLCGRFVICCLDHRSFSVFVHNLRLRPEIVLPLPLSSSRCCCVLVWRAKQIFRFDGYLLSSMIHPSAIGISHKSTLSFTSLQLVKEKQIGKNVCSLPSRDAPKICFIKQSVL